MPPHHAKPHPSSLWRQALLGSSLLALVALGLNVSAGLRSSLLAAWVPDAAQQQQQQQQPCRPEAGAGAGLDLTSPVALSGLMQKHGPAAMVTGVYDGEPLRHLAHTLATFQRNIPQQLPGWVHACSAHGCTTPRSLPPAPAVLARGENATLTLAYPIAWREPRLRGAHTPAPFKWCAVMFNDKYRIIYLKCPKTAGTPLIFYFGQW